MYNPATVMEACDYAPLIERAFSFVPGERDDVITDITGKIPSFVRGSYYLNGPARFIRGAVRYRHWLDGDGMICALHFGDNEVRCVNRFVRTKKFVEEEARGEAVFRAFGTTFNGDQLKRGLMVESPVNVSVYKFAGKLLAFGEQGLPYEVNPLTLETRGQFDFGRTLNDISPFAAHPKITPCTGEMFNFGVSFSGREPFLNLYRFDKNARLIYRQRFPLDYASSMHDFGLSENYVVFYVSPYILDMRAMSESGNNLQESLSWKPDYGSRLLIIERETGKLIAQIPVGNRYCLHFINCFEADGLLNVDLLELERPVYEQYQFLPEMFTNVCKGAPVRFMIDVQDHKLLDSISLLYIGMPDFPSIMPQQFTQHYEDFWMLGISAAGKTGRKFFDQLIHANWSNGALEVYKPDSGSYLGGEPIFIPDPEEKGQGVIICQLLDVARQTGAFALFEAADVAAGPIVLVKLQEMISPRFHACFEPVPFSAL